MYIAVETLLRDEKTASIWHYEEETLSCKRFQILGSISLFPFTELSLLRSALSEYRLNLLDKASAFRLAFGHGEKVVGCSSIAAATFENEGHALCLLCVKIKSFGVIAACALKKKADFPCNTILEFYRRSIKTIIKMVGCPSHEEPLTANTSLFPILVVMSAFPSDR